MSANEGGMLSLYLLARAQGCCAVRKASRSDGHQRLRRYEERQPSISRANSVRRSQNVSGTCRNGSDLRPFGPDIEAQSWGDVMAEQSNIRSTK